MRTLLLEASLEVRRPVFYATAAVAVAFLPIVMLSGLQGAFFRPLAIAFLLAVGLSLLVAMSATPALCALADAGLRSAVGTWLAAPLQGMAAAGDRCTRAAARAWC